MTAHAMGESTGAAGPAGFSGARPVNANAVETKLLSVPDGAGSEAGETVRVTGVGSPDVVTVDATTDCAGADDAVEVPVSAGLETFGADDGLVSNACVVWAPDLSALVGLIDVERGLSEPLLRSFAGGSVSGVDASSESSVSSSVDVSDSESESASSGEPCSAPTVTLGFLGVEFSDDESADGVASVEDSVVDSDVDAESADDAESDGVAKASPGVVATAIPTPSATAKPPTRPM
jgi:hypothetical protein